jgi:CO dehydrogenase/acetyl-CoA synthase epsilon subunit
MTVIVATQALAQLEEVKKIIGQQANRCGIAPSHPTSNSWEARRARRAYTLLLEIEEYLLDENYPGASSKVHTILEDVNGNECCYGARLLASCPEFTKLKDLLEQVNC